MGIKRCAACGDGFTQRRNVCGQQYCSKRGCQRERRRRWQRDKLKQDSDYRANQAAAQRRWRERHRDYWHKYRQSHREYTVRNREKQRERNRRRSRGGTRPWTASIAKMDVYEDKNIITSGTYRMIPESRPGIAKMDAYLVKIQVFSDSYSDRGGLQREYLMGKGRRGW
jgi:hypothetical protein